MQKRQVRFFLKSNNIWDAFYIAEVKCTSVGELDKEKIAFLKDKCPDLLEKIGNRTIIMWKDRLDHLKKHSYDGSHLSVEEMCELIPKIIDKPDYLGVRKKDLSVQFIKRYKENILVAVRMDGKGRLLFRTMYTITESQLSDYLNKGSAWEFKADN